MTISYNKLWKLMIDKNMKKKDLKAATSMGSTTLNKLTHDEIVSMDVMVKICYVMDCNMGDIVDVISKESI